MQVGVDVTYMHTNFGGCGLSGFGDIATFQKRPNFPFDPWTSKNLIDRNQLKKIMLVGVDVTYMLTSFGGCVLSGIGDIATFQKRPNFPFDPWSSKIIDRNRLKKIMQVGVDIKCMHTSFGECGLSGFGDIATFQKRPNFPFRAWTIVHGHQRI